MIYGNSMSYGCLFVIINIILNIYLFMFLKYRKIIDSINKIYCASHLCIFSTVGIFVCEILGYSLIFEIFYIYYFLHLYFHLCNITLLDYFHSRIK